MVLSGSASALAYGNVSGNLSYQLAETTISDSSIEKNLIYNSVGNETINILLPQNSIVSNANIDLTGIYTDPTFVGLAANATTREGYGSTFGTYQQLYQSITPTQNLFVNEFWVKIKKVTDSSGNYTNWGYAKFDIRYGSTSGPVIYTTSIHPDNIPNDYAWINITLDNPIFVFSGETIYIKFYMTDTYGEFSALKGPDGQYPYGTGYFDHPGNREGIMEKDILFKLYSTNFDNNPLNPSIDIASDGISEWSYRGSIANITVTTSDLSSALNSYLSICSPSNGNCTVPITVSSDASGIIKVSNINISYNTPQPTPTSTPTPPTITPPPTPTPQPTNEILGYIKAIVILGVIVIIILSVIAVEVYLLIRRKKQE